jgi:hypothetical protein
MAIDRALRTSDAKLTKAELRQVLAIAGLTPVEFVGLERRVIGTRS